MSLFITSLTWAAKVEVASQIGWHFIIRNEKCALHVYPYNAMHLPSSLYAVQLPNEPQVTEHLHYQYFDKFSR